MRALTVLGVTPYLSCRPLTPAAQVNIKRDSSIAKQQQTLTITVPLALG